MVHFTFKNGLAGKSLSAHNSFKSFIIMVVMLVMTASSVFAEVIDGLRYKLDTKMKTAILLPNTEKYSGDIVVPEKVKGNNGMEYSVIAIEEMCFYECSGLASIIIPPSVISIGNYCFADCNSLTSITIPSSVTSIGQYCFARCSKLSSVTIPSTVTSIGKYCFSDCSNLTSISIPSSVTSLGEQCFARCNKLTSITIPSSVTSMGDGCFAGCDSLTSISIPSSVTSLGDAVFSGCNKLSSITIPSSVTSIGSYCFGWCSSLTSITIPSSVNSLGGLCFNSCINLETVSFKGKLPVLYGTSSYSQLAIPTYCDIKVPAEYLQDYKDAFGPDYKYISAWNPNESGDDDKPVAPCATPSIFYGAGKLKFSSETAGAKYHYTISDKDMATDALCEDGNVSLSAAYDISVYATADGKLIGSSSAVDGTASCAVSETMVIAKFGDNAIKVAVK